MEYLELFPSAELKKKKKKRNTRLALVSIPTNTGEYSRLFIISRETNYSFQLSYQECKVQV